MTTVVAVKSNKGVTFAADTQVTDGTRPFRHNEMTKMVDGGRYIIGMAGDLAALQAIEHRWTIPLPSVRSTLSLFKFAITKIAPSLREFVDEANLFSDKQKESDATLFSILLAIDGTLLEIDDDYGVTMRDDGFHAIGSGSDYAIGALHMGADIIKALEIAALNDVNTSAPFTIIEQLRK